MAFSAEGTARAKGTTKQRAGSRFCSTRADRQEELAGVDRGSHHSRRPPLDESPCQHSPPSFAFRTVPLTPLHLGNFPRGFGPLSPPLDREHSCSRSPSTGPGTYESLDKCRLNE